MSAIYRFLLITAVLSAFGEGIRAQELATTDGAQQGAEPESGERIVDGRPALYTVKRWAHPLSWVGLPFKPVLRSAESGRLHDLMTRKPAEKTAGIRFGVGDLGIGSGLGPKVTFFTDDFLHRGIQVEVPLLYTYSRYQRYEINGRVPLLRDRFGQKLSFDLGAGYTSRAKDGFYGTGNESAVGDETQYRTVSREASAGLRVKLDDGWTARLRGVYRNVGVTRPTPGTSTQDRFDDRSAPGLTGAAIHSAVISVGRSAAVREDNAFKGSSEQLEVSFNRSSGGEFEYWRLHWDSQHFIPLSADGRKVLAARTLVETNLTPSGKRVPFFDMPFLGSSGTLRGFDNFRFRDKSAAGLSLEYRYRIWPSMDWGFFVDEGQVAAQFGDMTFTDFHTGYGARLFVWAKSNLPISIDYGRSREKWRMYVSINTSF